MLNIKAVLCPTDLSAVAESGMKLATQVCERFSARLVLHYNVDPLPAFYVSWPAGVPQSYLELDKEHEARAQSMLEEMAAALTGSFPREVRITKGQAHSSILQLGHDLRPDLIVMGTHGRTGLGHVLVGSIAERVLLESPCPVLTARKDGGEPLFGDLRNPDAYPEPQIVVAVDFSDQSSRMLDYAFQMVESVPGVLNLLHVIEPISWDDTRGATHFNVPEFLRYRMVEAGERLLAMIPREMAVKAHALVRIGSVVGEITSYASMVQANLILIGLKTRGVLQDLLFGSTTYGVLRTSPCPVWTVPAARPTVEYSEKETVATDFPYPCPQ